MVSTIPAEGPSRPTRRLSTLTLSLALCLLAGIGPSPRTTAQTLQVKPLPRIALKAQPLSGSSFSIKARHSSKCLDVSGGSEEVGAPVWQFSCGNEDSQTFTLTPEGDFHRIKAEHSQQCLDATKSRREIRISIKQSRCERFGSADKDKDEDEDKSQSFRLRSTESGKYYRIVAQQNGECLTVEDASNADRASVILEPCGEALSQQWTIRQARQTYRARTFKK